MRFRQQLFAPAKKCHLNPDVFLSGDHHNECGVSCGDIIALTVTIPQGFNSTGALTVTVINSNTNVINLPGSTNGLLTLTYPAGTTNMQTIVAGVLTIGTHSLTLSSGNVNGMPSCLSL